MQASIKYIKFSLLFLPVHFLSFYFSPLSLGLVYGPLIYAVVYAIPLRSFLLHLSLPILFFGYSLLYDYEILDWYNWFSLPLLSFYFLLCVISMTFYYVMIHFKKKEQKEKHSILKKELIHLLEIIYTIGTIFTFVLFLINIGLIDPIGFDPLFLINLLIGFTFIVALYYLIKSHKKGNLLKEISPNTSQNSKSMEELEKKIHVFFEETQLFLKSDISLEMLSEEVAIPKHHLSKLFNSYLNKSFYVVIGEYRIKHAQKRLKEDANLKIEYLAFECGFNSKSTFNKHFKEQVGSLPSEYRLNFS